MRGTIIAVMQEVTIRNEKIISFGSLEAFDISETLEKLPNHYEVKKSREWSPGFRRYYDRVDIIYKISENPGFEVVYKHNVYCVEDVIKIFRDEAIGDDPESSSGRRSIKNESG